MKILVTNDDGIYAKGIDALVNHLIDKGHDIYVVAPDRERSASGQAITLHHPLRTTKVLKWDKASAWAVDGTPTDCVKLGLSELIDEEVDLVISGINLGPNLGTDVLYSGTVSAAIEGAVSGVPAIAVSLAGTEKLDFSYSAKIACHYAELMQKNKVPKDTLVNINVPTEKEDKIKGIKYTTLGKVRYNNPFQKREDPRGRPYYWLSGEVNQDISNEKSDVYAVSENYVSICPIHFDFTNYRLLEIIEKWK
ncbi:5'/3'-nucleotidase SurE [Proteinivorax hydrogeniformans]|uniref:5'-nucleotidase SurE n=1 Tax=Proteinivorax hydrogeniformans TaxID=1826727 RepID=A0AAU8HWT0_9FIRM